MNASPLSVGTSLSSSTSYVTCLTKLNIKDISYTVLTRYNSLSDNLLLTAIPHDSSQRVYTYDGPLTSLRPAVVTMSIAEPSEYIRMILAAFQTQTGATTKRTRSQEHAAEKETEYEYELVTADDDADVDMTPAYADGTFGAKFKVYYRTQTGTARLPVCIAVVPLTHRGEYLPRIYSFVADIYRWSGELKAQTDDTRHRTQSFSRIHKFIAKIARDEHSRNADNFGLIPVPSPDDAVQATDEKQTEMKPLNMIDMKAVSEQIMLQSVGILNERKHIVRQLRDEIAALKCECETLRTQRAQRKKNEAETNIAADADHMHNDDTDGDGEAHPPPLSLSLSLSQSDISPPPFSSQSTGSRSHTQQSASQSQLPSLSEEPFSQSAAVSKPSIRKRARFNSAVSLIPPTDSLSLSQSRSLSQTPSLHLMTSQPQSASESLSLHADTANTARPRAADGKTHRETNGVEAKVNNVDARSGNIGLLNEGASSRVTRQSVRGDGNGKKDRGSNGGASALLSELT